MIARSDSLPEVEVEHAAEALASKNTSGGRRLDVPALEQAVVETLMIWLSAERGCCRTVLRSASFANTVVKRAAASTRTRYWDKGADENVIESVTLTYDFFELVQ